MLVYADTLSSYYPFKEETSQDKSKCELEGGQICVKHQ